MSPEATTGPAGAAFDVIDVLGLCRLERRSATLDGSVPLRAAQACNPLLEGNAHGLQLVWTAPVTVRRRAGRWALELGASQETLRRTHAAALPRLRAEGHLEPGGAWDRLLARGTVTLTGGLKQRLRLFTGLLVRPRPGHWLRLSSSANRRSTRYQVAETVVADASAPTPLVLELELESDPAPLTLQGELATLSVLRPGMAIEVASLADAPEVGRRHLEFFDRAYFQTKQGKSTRRYQKLLATRGGEGEERVGRCRLVVAGPSSHAVETFGRFAGPVGWTADAPAGPGLERVTFFNRHPFTARFDGHTVSLDYDRELLAREAAELRTLWAGVYGPQVLEQESTRGAVLYLAKYFTPHPPGEPHFFVKPWTFLCTPPGWSTLVEGRHGPGYDVLRGVVWTDRFHATPAVFRLHAERGLVRVPAGTPLLQAIPIPRDLDTAGFDLERW